MTPSQVLLDRMRGCMVGAVLGDCLGAPVECAHWYGIDRKVVRKHFDQLRATLHNYLTGLPWKR